ncbi:MAG: ABC transporter ATP-binding protein [Gammaproteobacteria bacterium]|nr:ABC transporter ATP-binding protein [Gammaproteobacteria bacterium]
MALLEVDKVNKAFGGVQANQDVSIQVEEGAIVGLIGPNGSGKTTLFNSIVGTHPIDSGEVYFRGRPLSKLWTSVIARRGLLRTFQQTRIYGRMDCMQNMLISEPHRKDNVLDMFREHDPALHERAEDLLEFVGLYEKRFMFAGELSFGQQKLLEFAMALMNDPGMLLDEPTAGINPTLINGLMDRLRRANAERGVTLLVIEHNMRVIMDLAQHIYCMSHGRVLAEGRPEEVRDNPDVIDAYLGEQ